MRARKLALFALLLAGCSDATTTTSLSDAAVGFSLRGHDELVKTQDGSFTPLYFLPDVQVDACFTAPVDTDTTRWKARVEVGLGNAADWVAPREQLGRTLCFAVPFAESLAAGIHPFRIELIDEFDGQLLRRVEASVETMETPARYAAILDELNALFAALDFETLFVNLDRIRSQALKANYPFLAARLRLVHVYYLRTSGTPDGRSQAARLLSLSPDWIDGPHADVWAAQQSYERASLGLELGEPRSVIWQHLSEAEDRYLEIADSRRITAVMKQADLLARSGSTETGRARLKAALLDCERSTCADRFQTAARNTLAWLALQDPETAREDLIEVHAYLDSPPTEQVSGTERLEEGNRLTNLALVSARLGRDPAKILERLRSVLQHESIDSARAEWLLAWGAMSRAEHALRSGSPAAASEICQVVWDEAATPDLAAQARSCMARAFAQRGDFAQAYTEVQNALVVADAPDASTHAWISPTSDANRSHNVRFAASLALRLDLGSESWKWLESLDVSRDRTEQSCDRLDDSSQELAEAIRQLSKIEGPASRDLQRRRNQIRPRLLLRAQQALRDRLECQADAEGRARLDQIEYRAFVYADQIILLHRAPGRRAVTSWGTPFAPGQLKALLDEMTDALQRRSHSELEWRSLVQPLAAALLPPERDLQQRLTYALHGSLQSVPLAALPIPNSADYLADRALVVRVPAGGSGARGKPRADVDAEPLFVVDPLGNLAGSSAWVAAYRAAFPGAQILEGSQATQERVKRELNDARFLHVDAHGLFDPVFPELSRVRLFDGDVSLLSWTDQAVELEFANLSMCASGRWPIRPQSGQFGAAGLFARAGAAYVVAAQADLPNRVAHVFNREFYRTLAESDDPENAFRAGFSAVRQEFRAVEWAPLVLLKSPGREINSEKVLSQGESGRGSTLTEVRRGTRSSNTLLSGESL